MRILGAEGILEVKVKGLLRRLTKFYIAIASPTKFKLFQVKIFRHKHVESKQ